MHSKTSIYDLLLLLHLAHTKGLLINRLDLELLLIHHEVSKHKILLHLLQHSYQHIIQAKIESFLHLLQLLDIQFFEEILLALEDECVIKWAFNATFERICLSRFLGYPTGEYLKPESWRCSMIWSATMGLPLSLEGVTNQKAL